MLGNGLLVLGNELHKLHAYVRYSNWPHVLGIMSQSGLCRLELCPIGDYVVRDYVIWDYIVRDYVTFRVMSF